jgi:HEAT repeat protein
MPRPLRTAPAPIRAVLMAPLLATALSACGCQGGAGTAAPTASVSPRSEAAAVPRPADDPRLGPYMERFARVEGEIARWDALRADGRAAEADALAMDVRRDVDASYADFERAAGGSLGPHAQYLGVSALGFASAPQATTALVGRLRDGDAQLVGNALIALSVREDAATPLPPVIAHVGPDRPLPSKRYAPLVLAHVLEARARAGAAPETALEVEALARLRPMAVDQDPIARLHVAKALGALRVPGAVEPLNVLVGDPQMRIRWAAAAALERQGDPLGFPGVVRLLHEVAPESKSVIRDVLVSYAGRLQGRPLSPTELASLGTGARAWSQWFTLFKRSRGLRDDGASSVDLR